MQPELKRILYLEDEEAIAIVARMALEELSGFEVRHATSGQAALDAYEDFAPQLFLLDVMVPGMDGTETLRRLRQLPGGEDVPAIFMTAKAQTHEQAAYMEMGVLSVIVKPFDPVTLGDTIRALWDAQQAGFALRSGTGN